MAVNKCEQRLYQINILINAYKKEGTEYNEEIQKLETEKKEILKHINYME